MTWIRKERHGGHQLRLQEQEGMLRPPDTCSRSHSVPGRGRGRNGLEMRLKSEIDQVDKTEGERRREERDIETEAEEERRGDFRDEVDGDEVE